MWVSQVRLWPLTSRLLIMKRLIVCIGRATLISVYSLQKLVILGHSEVLIAWISLWTVTSSLFLFSDDVLVVLEKLGSFLFGGSLGSTVWLVGLSRLLAWLVPWRLLLVWGDAWILVQKWGHHALRVVLRLSKCPGATWILENDLLLASCSWVACPRSSAWLSPLRSRVSSTHATSINSTNANLAFRIVSVSLLVVAIIHILHLLLLVHDIVEGLALGLLRLVVLVSIGETVVYHTKAGVWRWDVLGRLWVVVCLWWVLSRCCELSRSTSCPSSRLRALSSIRAHPRRWMLLLSGKIVLRLLLLRMSTI